MSEDRDYEAEAKEQGWKPQEEFTGPEDKWTDAQTFVEKGEKIAGIAMAQRDGFKEKNARLEARVQRLEIDNKQFGEYQKNLLTKEKSRNADLLAELEGRRATAITDGDGAEFTRLDREIQQTRDDIRQPVTNGQDIDPLGQAWLLNNDWYNTNQSITSRSLPVR